ncbi:MAG: 50S ribosomal protein L18e [Desulfurococcaceae archaeon]
MELRATNVLRRRLVDSLLKAARENSAPIWGKVAEELAKPRRRRRAVNISRINRYTKPGDVVVVPGKVLGSGVLDHAVTVAAFSFSKSALETIRRAGGRAMSIEALVKENPKGAGVKVIG